MANPAINIVQMPDAGKDKFNEQLYVQKFLKTAPPVRCQRDIWYVWDKSAWVVTPKEEFSSFAMGIIPSRLRLVKHAKSVVDAVEWTQQLKTGEEFFGACRFEKDEEGNERVLLNVKNCVLRITADKVEVLPHKKEYYFTSALTAEWQEDESKAKRELFDRVLAESLPDSGDRSLIQWFSGYLLFPSTKHEVFLLCYGEGGTGKSTLSEVIVEVIGREPLVTALSMGQICAEGQGGYSLPALKGALVNLGSELDTVELGDSANFKKICSGETIEARTIYGKPFSMRTNAKLWFNSNSLPRFKHGTEAELRRARFLWFDQKRTDENKDVTLKDKLKGEIDGVLRWMVEGLQFLMGGMTAPPGGLKSARVKAKFAIANDMVKSCVTELCVIDKDAEVKKDELGAAFTGYLDSYGHGQKSRDFLFKSLWERYPDLVNHRYQHEHTIVVANKREAAYYVRGIRLKENANWLKINEATEMEDDGIGHE